MGDKEFNGDKEEGFKFCWEGYDGDIEEERREIEERVSKIEDFEEREARYEQLLNALEYNEYFALNPHFKCESYLSNMRKSFEMCKDKDKGIEDFIDRILRYANMKRCLWSDTQNILIVNGNRKFTFLNTTKRDIRNHPCLYEILKKGKTKLRREFGDRWMEGYDDETKFSVLWVRSCGWEEDE